MQRHVCVLSPILFSLFINEIASTIEKRKIMVFRKGGFGGSHKKWNLDGKNLEVVNEYTYLGYIFTTKMSVAKGIDVLAAKGKRACIECVRYVDRLSDMS